MEKIFGRPVVTQEDMKRRIEGWGVRLPLIMRGRI